MEVWKDIKGFEGFQVSTEGKVRSVDRYINGKYGMQLRKGKEIKQWVSNSGYLTVSLNIAKKKTNLMVHRLVAETFLQQPEGKGYVNHIDGNKVNNTVANLEWVTRSENQKHAYRMGLIKNPVEKKAVLQIDKVSGKVITRYASILEASKAMGKQKSDGNISKACKGIYKTMYGTYGRMKMR